MADDTTLSASDSITTTDLPFVIRFARILAEDFKDKYNLRFADIEVDQLAAEIQANIDLILPTSIALNTARPDFDSNLLRLMQEVERGDAWKDTSFSSTGQMLLRAIATDIDYGQFSIMRALQEAYPFTARNPSSVFTAARSNGLRIQRKIPAKRTVTFTRPDEGVPLYIDPWTPFVIDDATFFNREQINFEENDITVVAVLHEGTPDSVTVTSTGVPLQLIEFGNETQKISDTDVRVTVNGVAWSRTEASPWNLAPDEQVFWENTLPSGDVEIRFGDGRYGAAPVNGVPIEIDWIETNGAGGNDVRSDLQVTWPTAPSGISVVGATNGPATDGADELSVDYYQIFIGDRRGADAGNARRAVRRPDFRAHACAFPGVFDAVIRGQAEIAPERRSWMNVLGVTLLTDPVFTDAQWQDWLEYMRPLYLENLQLVRMDPTVLTVDVNATLGLTLEADKGVVKSRVLSNLVNTLKPRIGSLGFSFYRSDIENVLKGNPPPLFKRVTDQRASRNYDLPSLIDWVDLDPNFGDQLLDSPLYWLKLGKVNLNPVYSKRGYTGKY